MPAALFALIALIGSPVSAAFELTTSSAGMAGMATLAIVALAAVILCVAAGFRTAASTSPGSLVSSAVRQRGERTVYLPQRAPDAAGRPRPRAPSAQPGPRRLL